MTYCLLCVQSVLSHRSDLPEKAKKPFKALTVLGSKRHRYACLGVRTKQAAQHTLRTVHATFEYSLVDVEYKWPLPSWPRISHKTILH